MTEKHIGIYGLCPTRHDQLAAIRAILVYETGRERQRQGQGNTELMKLCCVQLFSQGVLGDIPIIWDAKSASMDSDCSVDIHLLCGAGLDESKSFLRNTGADWACHALMRIEQCEYAGDFEGYTIDEQMGFYEEYYS